MNQALQIKVNYPYKDLTEILPNGNFTVLLCLEESAAMAACLFPPWHSLVQHICCFSCYQSLWQIPVPIWTLPTCFAW